MQHIHVSKVDFCSDLAGSFIPESASTAYLEMQSLVQEAVDQMGADPGLSLFLRRSGDGLIVTRGDNILETSFQYVVTDQDGDKLMVIKYYDKTLDLQGREATKLVGSRFSKILGSKLEITHLETTVRRA